MFQISIFVLLEFEVGLKSTTKAEAELGFYPEGPEIKYIYNSVKKKKFYMYNTCTNDTWRVA